jgi:hypothetical protein
MVLLRAGDNLIASHLPLYAAPHHYQLIYEVTFSDEIKQQQALDLLDQGRVTFLPEVFDLTTLVKGETTNKQVQVFDGHFERGGKALFNAKLEFSKPLFIRDIAYVKKAITPVVEHIPLSNNKVLSVHHIGSVPSFDAIGITDSDGISALDERSTIQCAGIDLTGSESAVTKALSRCVKTQWLYVELRDFR